MSSSSEPWTANTFHCENPDFIVKSIPDDVRFSVNRASMQNSEVFRDMFSFGETPSSSDPESESSDHQSVDLHETSGVLVALLRLLHYPPEPPAILPPDESSEEAQLSSRIPRKKNYDPATVIPLPILLSLLYGLVDKYALPESISESLNVHLAAHAPAYPLRVYGFATVQGLHKVASDAKIPNVAAYHKLVRLQDARVKALRELVLGEDIFPHGYGACPNHHQETISTWNAKRTALAPRIETVTDVAAEMYTLTDTLPSGCKACHKACSAAVKMLAYKSRKTLRRIDQLPTES
ncbi:hypothetical protein Hypma_015247 [Hypsizygus marmoreus]|uniref:BTB domain-containing protein n=1 Tax=Hypsizygus marmoreus TaxID=39966 RepID=A0A369KA98_HYPMA|nr:hypothetical protein Hypma_015247 [Hypsizygus marmoreus]